MLRPRIGGKDVIILTGSVKPRSPRSAILRRTLSIASPPISGKEVTIFTGSAKPSSWRSAILSDLIAASSVLPELDLTGSAMVERSGGRPISLGCDHLLLRHWYRVQEGLPSETGKTGGFPWIR